MQARSKSRRVAALAAVLLLVALTSFSPSAAAQGEDASPDRTADRPGRLLVFSVPGLTWADVANFQLPAMDRFFASSSMADLAPRGVSARSGPGDAYLTISGGSRAATDSSIDGQVLGIEEQSQGSAAGDIFMRRTGEEAYGPYVSLTWPSLVRANDAQPFDTQLGSLTESLELGGVSAAAIGNADGTDSIGDSYERQAGLALADPRGIVPAGALGKELLVDDPSQPYGVRLDPVVTTEEFERAWADAEPSDTSNGGVVLVESSDLARTLRYRPIVDFDRYSQMWAEAIDHTDELFASIMADVDLTKDSVMVVAPYNKRGDRDLTVVAMDGPDIPSGYMRSASTQRAGFLTLVDIGPTILDRFGLDRPVEMEGRPAVFESSGDGPGRRVDHLITLNRASRFREQLLTPTTTLVVIAFAAILALAIAAHANRWGPRARRAIGFLALADLTILPVSYLARFFALEERGTNFYWTFLLGCSLAYPAIACAIANRRGSTHRRRGPLMAVLALMALVLIGDVMTGSHLSLSAAFGYSATGNSRLYGISNYSYGQVAAATCMLAGWVALVRPGRQGKVLGIATMVVTLVVLGVPIWGSDVGGVLAFTPATLAFAVVITDRRIQARTILIGGAATAAAIGLFGLLDLARAPANRGHLGRLFERVGDEGLSPLLSVVQRKLLANLEVSTSSMWVLAIPLGLAFWVFLRRYPDQPYRTLVTSFSTLPASLTAALAAGVLGSALNDSGAIIGGIMAMVVGASLAVLLLDEEPLRSPPASEPSAPSSEELDAKSAEVAPSR